MINFGIRVANSIMNNEKKSITSSSPIDTVNMIKKFLIDTYLFTFNIPRVVKEFFLYLVFFIIFFVIMVNPAECICQEE